MLALILPIITTTGGVNLQANKSCVRSKLDMKASELIHVSVLEKHGVDGNFNAPCMHPINIKCILFFISDPPHPTPCPKKVWFVVEHCVSCIGMNVLMIGMDVLMKTSILYEV